MVSFFVVAAVSFLSVLTERILIKLFYNNNNNVNNINIDYQPQTTQDEIVIVTESNSNNKLFKFSNYI